MVPRSMTPVVPAVQGLESPGQRKKWTVPVGVGPPSPVILAVSLAGEPMTSEELSGWASRSAQGAAATGARVAPTEVPWSTKVPA